MNIGAQVRYVATENSPIFQTINYPIDGQVECVIIENGPLSVDSISLNVNKIEEIE